MTCYHPLPQVYLDKQNDSDFMGLYVRAINSHGQTMFTRFGFVKTDSKDRLVPLHMSLNPFYETNAAGERIFKGLIVPSVMEAPDPGESELGFVALSWGSFFPQSTYNMVAHFGLSARSCAEDELGVEIWGSEREQWEHYNRGLEAEARGFMRPL